MQSGYKPKITIYTLAYNAENYIRECAESVLNQTFPDFEWVVLNNGSTDRTGEILEYYANQDSRVKLFRNEKNTLIEKAEYNPQFIRYMESLETEYICILDSDDYLDADFLKVLYESAVQHQADIVLGGTKMFWDAGEGEPIYRCPPDFYTRHISDLGDIWPEVYGCFRPMWGKLVKNSVYQSYQKLSKQSPVRLMNAKDTIFNLGWLGLSKSVAGVSKVLYYYRIRTNSFYHSHIHPRRYLDYLYIFEEGKKLLKKWEKWNPQNQQFLAQVLLASIKDVLHLTAKGKNVSAGEKLEIMADTLADEKLHQILKNAGLLNVLMGTATHEVHDLTKDMSEQDMFQVMDQYLFRLTRSLDMVKAKTSIENAALLYLSAVCDPRNQNRMGIDFLFQFFRILRHPFLAELSEKGVSGEFLATNPILLRELVNGHYQNAARICMDQKDSMHPALLRELKNMRAAPEQTGMMKEELARHMANDNLEEAAGLVFEILQQKPLDKEALIHKIYLLTVYGDLLTALETAEALRVFYPDDGSALSFAAQAYANAGREERSRELFRQALRVCRHDDEKQQVEDAYRSYFGDKAGVESIP